jgi:Flp pilus assembly protein TadG
MSKIHWPWDICRQRGWLSRYRSFWSDKRGVVAVIVGLLATVVIAFVGLGIDLIDWYRTDRAMQMRPIQRL